MKSTFYVNDSHLLVCTPSALRYPSIDQQCAERHRINIVCRTINPGLCERAPKKTHCETKIVIKLNTAQRDKRNITRHEGSTDGSKEERLTQVGFLSTVSGIGSDEGVPRRK